jgi:hypothetical protein
MRLHPLIRSLVASTVLYLCLLILGLFLREELKRSNSGVLTSLAQASAIVRACEHNEGNAEVSRSLVVYLAIENYFCQKSIREIEFFLATMSSYFGFPKVKTIGVGKISLGRFESVYRFEDGDDRRRIWIQKLREDCVNVRFLEQLASKSRCRQPNEKLCVLQDICLWHAGVHTDCFADARHLRYIHSAAVWYDALKGMNGTIP